MVSMMVYLLSARVVTIRPPLMLARHWGGCGPQHTTPALGADAPRSPRPTRSVYEPYDVVYKPYSMFYNIEHVLWP